jgi:hypothetical protein
MTYGTGSWQVHTGTQNEIGLMFPIEFNPTEKIFILFFFKFLTISGKYSDKILPVAVPHLREAH